MAFRKAGWVLEVQSETANETGETHILSVSVTNTTPVLDFAADSQVAAKSARDEVEVVLHPAADLRNESRATVAIAATGVVATEKHRLLEGQVER